MFQVPMQYCSLKHQTLLSPPDTTRAQCHFRFGSVSSFFQVVFLHSSLVAYWTPIVLVGSSLRVVSFLLFHSVHGILKARVLSGLLFSSLVSQVLLELPTTTHPSWGPCMAWLIVSWATQRCDPCDHFGYSSVIVIFIVEAMRLKFLLLLSALWWMRIRGLCKLLDGRDWLLGKLSLALVGRAMFSKSFIQFSANGWDCGSSLW